MKMDILFTGGAIPAKSIKPLSLIKTRSKYGGRDEVGSCPYRAITSKYSEKVLVGNWYDERIVCPARSSGEWTTDYVESYKAHDAKDLTEDLYINWKNKQKIQDDAMKGATDGESYMDNMASSYDLNFRILTRGLCGPRKRVYSRKRHAWEPEADLTLSYGNATKYGLVDIVRAKQRVEGLRPPFKSTYQLDYDEKSSQRDTNEKRFLKPRGDTSLDLRHLGIDLSSRPIAREPQYRNSRCDRVCTWL